MNRAVTFDLGALGQMLPPTSRNGRTRVLFLHSTALGHSTYGRLIERYAAEAANLEAVHVYFTPSRSVRAATKALTGFRALDFAGSGRMLLWRRTATRRLAGVPLDRFDVIHAATQPLGFAVLPMARRAGVPLVVNVDCTSASYARLNGGLSPDDRLVRSMERRLFQFAALAVAWSEWAATSVVEDCGVRPELVEVVPPTVPLGSFERRSDRGESRRLLRIGFVGNQWNRKGGPELLEWHQRHWSGRAELHVVSGGVRPDSRAANVVWHGSLAHGEITSRLLPMLDMFVLPTRHDVFGLAVLEAAGSALPVVTTRMAALPELVVHDETGFLCARGDAASFVASVGRLLDDAALRTRMGAAARRHVDERFNPAQWYPRLFALLDAVGTGGRPGRASAGLRRFA